MFVNYFFRGTTTNMSDAKQSWQSRPWSRTTHTKILISCYHLQQQQHLNMIPTSSFIHCQESLNNLSSLATIRCRHVWVESRWTPPSSGRGCLWWWTGWRSSVMTRWHSSSQLSVPTSEHLSSTSSHLSCRSTTLVSTISVSPAAPTHCPCCQVTWLSASSPCCPPQTWPLPPASAPPGDTWLWPAHCGKHSAGDHQ